MIEMNETIEVDIMEETKKSIYCDIAGYYILSLSKNDDDVKNMRLSHKANRRKMKTHSWMKVYTIVDQDGR